jgi:hypothetical protein
MRRRDLLTGFGISTLALTPLRSALGAAVQQSTGVDLSATVTINGKQLEYRAASGQDLGDFQGQNFVQRCIRVMRPDSPLTIYFRPDRTSDRVEVIFELGRIWGAANRAAAHLGPYSVEIKRAGNIIASIDVPFHWWFSRWRWQSTPRPVVRAPQELMNARLIMPYSTEIARMAGAVNSTGVTYRRPMDIAGIMVDMGSTGERPEIGPTTEYQATYLTTLDPSALSASLAQAEAAGSIPIHIRDENTGAPVNFYQYPKISWYYIPQGNTWIKTNGDSRDGLKCPWRSSDAHDPALSYVPYLLTGDPYFLETLQFQGNQALGWTNYHRGSGLQVVDPGQTRGEAWSLRTIFQLAKVSPDAPPKWLLPRAYWKHVLDDNRTYFTRTYINQTARASTVFHAATKLSAIAGWQEDFLACMLGWGVLMGFDEWRPAFLWKLQATLARTNGKSGWPRQFCSPYYYLIAKDLHDPVTEASGISPDVWFKDWAEAWKVFRSDPNNKVAEPFTDDVSWQEGGMTPDYLIYTRGVLALAAALGVAEAKEPHQFVNGMTVRRNYMTYRWAIGRDG